MAHHVSASASSEASAAPAFQPYVPASQSPAEFTFKAVIIGVLFGLLFGASTVYLGLRAGLTVSASIPIAVLAISVLKRLGGSTILENNIVQTIGSAGEGAERDLQISEVAGAVREEEEEGREGEDDAGRNRLAGGPDGLDDVVLEDRRAAQLLEYRDGQDRDRDRRADRQPGPQAEIYGRRAEDQSEQRAEDDGLDRELRG